ncbi:MULTISPECIES: hypothetical protein [unclassified Amycolatopsis]|uniref:hypothetical protein n=1 Tax=unclassified Amycolatopsis TaxID=2618356 RepID=UPI002E1A243E|nr:MULTISPECIES: hypothetical protein [unclassified Amycolatopsis]
MTEFGCARCYGKDALTAMAFCTTRLRETHRLVQQSHFGVSLRECPECGQAFASIFTEFVDWTGGEDAQFFDIVPLTGTEVISLAAQGSGVDLVTLGALGSRRRRLSSAWPTGGAKTISWKSEPLSVREGH